MSEFFCSEITVIVKTQTGVTTVVMKGSPAIGEMSIEANEEFPDIIANPSDHIRLSPTVDYSLKLSAERILEYTVETTETGLASLINEEGTT